MNIPTILTAKAIDDYTLVIEFKNRQKKKYDVVPLLKTERFFPLKNLAMFKMVQVEQGGYAVFWNSDIDISEYELWNNGQIIS